MKKPRWVALLGQFEMRDDTFVFKGGEVEAVPGISPPPAAPIPAVGNFICDTEFAGGVVSAEVEFCQVSDVSSCEFILHHNPETHHLLVAGLNNISLCEIRYWDARKWTWYGAVGNKGALESGKKYTLAASVHGSRIAISLEGSDLLAITLPVPLPTSNVGLWCMDYSQILVRDFSVSVERPKVFVVMQFTSPYNEVYDEVIKEVCQELDLQAVRADEVYGPGQIIADVVRNIIESKIIIADVSPRNANVFYEVGYAHALKKPTILIAEKSTDLPFDLSSFRTLFYEDSIGGKTKIEQGLRNHLKAILKGEG